MGLSLPSPPCAMCSCIKYILLLELYTKWIWTVADGRHVRYERLVYTVFYIQENYALSSLQSRGVSAIQRFLMYTSNGSSTGTWVNVHYKAVVHIQGCHCILFTITRYLYTLANIPGRDMLLLRLVSEYCQTSTSAGVIFEWLHHHWTTSQPVLNHHTTGWWV